MNETFLTVIAGVVFIMASYFFLKHNIPIFPTAKNTATVNSTKSPYVPINFVPYKVTSTGPKTPVTPDEPSNYSDSQYVTFSINTTSRTKEPNDEHVTIRLSPKAPQKVKITGWKIKSNYSGEDVTIPQATGWYYPGSQSFLEDVHLNPGETAYISTGQSPIGVSFKTNLCSGYLENYYDFYPSIPRYCPDIKSLAHFPDNPYYASCWNTIESLSKCAVVPKLPANIASDCAQFLTKNLNYKSCVDNFSSTQNFKGKDWRIYLGRSETLWKTDRERIILLNSAGETVASYSN